MIYAVIGVGESGNSAPTTAPVAKYEDFTVTGAGLKFRLGGQDVRLGSKEQEKPTSIPRKLFDTAAEKVTDKLKEVASDLTGGMSDWFKLVTTGDANLVVQNVSDYLQAKGTVAVTINGKTTKQEVEVEVEFDAQDTGNPPPIIPNNIDEVIAVVKTVLKKTYTRNPKDIAAEIQQQLEAQAIKQAQGD